MAIYHFSAKIVKASAGKCAVASAAYQSAETLYDEKYGKTFSYSNKEEVVHSEIQLPENAPGEFLDREKLWNSVEEKNNRINSQYARQFTIAIPNEWSREETIERMHEFFDKEFVSKGIVVDWSYHEKDGNHHVHAMTTLRGFNPNGTWAQMEKKEYALDDKGNRIPEIDPKTGEQKVRERDRDGHHSVEKIWKRITVQSNSWNSREQLKEWRSNWAEFANRYLPEEEKIDHRSYVERGIEKVAQNHEGYAAREIENRGGHSERMEENREVSRVNSIFDEARVFVEKARSVLSDFKKYIQERVIDGVRKEESRLVGADNESGGRVSRFDEGSNERTEISRHEFASSTREVGASGRGDFEFKESYSRISGIRERLHELGERNRAIVTAIGNLGERISGIQNITDRINSIREERRVANERAEQIRRSLLAGVGGAVNSDGGSGTASDPSAEGGRTEESDTAKLIREIRTNADTIRTKLADRRSEESNRGNVVPRFREGERTSAEGRDTRIESAAKETRTGVKHS